MYNELDQKLPIWIIGHAGHDEPGKESNLTTPPTKGNEHLYDLHGQFNHKIDFVTRFIPKDVKVHLIGHSIGSKCCLELLKLREFSEQVEHCYLLFPTIERMAESDKGKNVPTYNRFSFILRPIYYSFAWLPISWRKSIVRWKCRQDGMVGDELLEPSVGFTNPQVIDRVWLMTLDEMIKVRDVDEDVIKPNINRLKLYYSTKDGWVPKSYQQDMLDRFPGIDAELCKQGYEHAFVLSTGPEVGKMVAEWISLKGNLKQS